MPLCKDCNRRVLCVTVSETGLTLYVDAEPSPDGKWSFCGVAKVTSAAATGRREDVDYHASHFATCRGPRVRGQRS